MPNIGSSMVAQGKWVNIHTNDVVMVRDTIQDGEQMLVITDKGQIPMKDFVNYVQIEDGEVIPTLQDLYGNPQTNNALLAQINQGIPAEDRITTNTNANNKKYDKLLEGLGESKQTDKPKLTNKEEKSVIEIKEDINKNKEETKKKQNYELIKKVFDKFPIERSIEFSIIEEEWPFKEFNMLVNILDVPVEDICSYVIDNYLDKENLVKALTKYFRQFIK